MDAAREDLAKRAAELRHAVSEYVACACMKPEHAAEMRVLNAALCSARALEWILAGEICPTSRPRV